MEFTIDRDSFLKSLGHANGIIEKKTTLPILSNILIEAKNSKVKITATDLDIVYFEEINTKEIKKEGSTTTSSNILYDILRKLQSGSQVELNLLSKNKLKKGLESELNLQLVQNKDILKKISQSKNRPRLVIGFSAETQKVIEHAKEKRVNKKCDWILANDVSRSDSSMGGDFNVITLVTSEGV